MPNDMSNFTGPTDRSVIECPPVSNNSNNSTHMINNQQQQQQAAQSNDKRSPLAGFYWALTRKKPLDRRTETNLNRCLGLLDLTTLGNYIINATQSVLKFTNNKKLIEIKSHSLCWHAD